jgi:hypothetical protein
LATIEGRTDVIRHEAAATRMAKTAGTGAVDNRAEVSEAAQEKGGGEFGRGPARVQVKRGDARSEARDR